MKNYQLGEVVLLEFKYTSVTEYKRRPGLIIMDTGDADIIVARITSKITMTDFDVELSQWGKAGLLQPSIVRLHKLNTLEKRLVERKLGNLEPDDLVQVKYCLQQMWLSI